jgi:hypothetical protein
MPQRITLLDVFVSCPKDLAAELGILDNVIKELNPRLRDSHSVELRLVTHGNFVVPAIGSDPQDVINSQIADHYDIYIGMLGHRFGTQTPRAGSGTEEEFHLARDRWRRSPDSLRILFYFKNIPDVPVQKLDLKQLAKVQDFRREIGREILYCDFRTTDDFLPLVREHLWKLVATQWDGTRWKVRPAALPVQAKEIGIVADVTVATNVALEPIAQDAKSPEAATAEHVDDDVDETLGVLDALVEAEESLQAGFAALDRIVLSTAAQNHRFEEHAKLINFVNAQNPGSTKHLKSAVDATADDLAAYARSLRAEIPAFTAGFTAGFEAFDVAMAAWIEEKPKPEEVLKIQQILERGVSSVRSSREPVITFRNTIAKIPKLTARLRKATRATRTQLDELIAGITIISDRASAVSSRFQVATEEARKTELK